LSANNRGERFQFQVRERLSVAIRADGFVTKADSPTTAAKQLGAIAITNGYKNQSDTAQVTFAVT
jgi:hypothetical protein